MGFVAEDAAGAAGGGFAGGVRDDAFLVKAVRQAGVSGWRRVAVRVGDEDVLVTVRC